MEIVRKPLVRRLVPFFLCVCLLVGIIGQTRSEAVALVVPVGVAVIIGAILLACGISFRDEGGLVGAINQFWEWLQDTGETIYAGVADWLNDKAGQVGGVLAVLTVARNVWDCVMYWVKSVFGANPPSTVEIPLSGYENLLHFNDFESFEASLMPYYNHEYSNSNALNYGLANKAELTFMGRKLYFSGVGNFIYLDFTYDDLEVRFQNLCSFGRTPWFDPSFIRFASLPGELVIAFPEFGSRTDNRTRLYTYYYSSSPATGIRFKTASGDYVSGEIEDGHYIYKADGKIYDFGPVDGVGTRPGNSAKLLYNIFVSGQATIKANVMVDYYPDVGVFNPGNTGVDDDVKIKVPVNIGSLVNAHPSTVTQVTTAPPPNMGDVSKFRAPSLILQKFPFCIPYDVYTAFSMMIAEPETPRWEIPFNIPSIGFTYNFVIDLEQFDTLAKITRWFLSAVFMIGLVMATRKLIKG